MHAIIVYPTGMHLVCQINVFLFSKFLYDLYTKEGKLPPIGNTTILQKWLTKIGKELHLNLYCTKTLKTRVYKRTSFIVNEIRKLHYRCCQVQEFLQKEWLTSKDIKTSRQNIVEKQLTSQRDALKKTKLFKVNPKSILEIRKANYFIVLSGTKSSK